MSIDNTPWTARQWQKESYIYCWEVRDSKSDDVVLCCTKDQALLFAAAPELLEACEAALGNMNYFGDSSQMDMAAKNKLQAAIAKAKGESCVNQNTLPHRL